MSMFLPGDPHLWSDDPLDRSLVADWRIDRETGLIIPDYSGYGHRGTVNGLSWISTLFGPGLSFPGAGNNRVEIADHSALDFVTGESLTWEIFFRPTNDTVMVAIKGGSSGAVTNFNYAAVIPAAGKFAYAHRTAAAAWHRYETNGNPLISGSDQHIAATYTQGIGASAVLYYNGEVEAGGWVVGDGDTAGAVNDEELWIGNDRWNERFAGVIYLVRIYNRILSAEEVRRRYEICTARASGMANAMMPYWGEVVAAEVPRHPAAYNTLAIY